MVRLKLTDLITQLGHQVVVHGPKEEKPEPVDYPDVAGAVARDVCSRQADRGVLICGTGIGMCIAANKFRGIRAATIVDELSAEISRRHNDLNILCLSGDLMSEHAAEQIVRVWLNTPFDDGRHTRRIEKITEFERQQYAVPEPSGDYPCNE
ncbi:MAG: RpiB/LacA/LacB family sugar-phosphate isomerase [Planctomycetaceae bacterium]|nr:RpiB/LacA/LacB family sugar-phosphate isomerase [Planctomycetaceae bacterium]